MIEASAMRRRENFGERIGQAYLAIPDGHLYILLAVVFAATLWAGADRFFTAGNLLSIGFQMPELGLLTLAVAITLISGGINLATVGTANFAGFVMIFMLHAGFVATLPPWAGGAYSVGVILVGAFAGAVLGAMNGVIIAVLGVSPILTTLGTMTLLSGINLLFTHGSGATGVPPALVAFMNGTLLYVPAPLWIFAIAAAFVAFLLRRTRFGIALYMLGSNERATAFSGVDVRRLVVLTYALSGLLSALAGLVMMCRFNSVNSNYGASYLLVSILAAVLGGISPSGGRGKVGGMVVALVLLQWISSIMNLMSWSAHLTLAAWGALLLVGLAVTRR